MRRLPDNWTPKAWLEAHWPAIGEVFTSRGGSYEEVAKLAEGKTYAEFCEAFGEYFVSLLRSPDYS